MRFPIPVDLGSGRLRISIEEIQTEGSRITSRDVLMPLLLSGRFEELEILCKHVPSWLAMELSSCEYGGQIDRVSLEQMRVIVSKSASCGVISII